MPNSGVTSYSQRTHQACARFSYELFVTGVARHPPGNANALFDSLVVQDAVLRSECTSTTLA